MPRTVWVVECLFNGEWHWMAIYYNRATARVAAAGSRGRGETVRVAKYVREAC